MASDKLREQLELRPVESKYVDQFNELLRYVFQVTNHMLQKSGYEVGEIVRAKRPILENADVVGWFNGEQLVSQLCIYPCKVNVHGKIYKMGGVTGIGTYPEYANLGLMNDLIRVGLENMRKKGQLISYLYPYSIPYYRKKGWEIVTEHLTFSIKDTQIPKYDDLPGFVERLPIDNPDVIETYDRFARTNHGAMIRGKMEWEEYWRWENEEERTAAVYYNSQDKPMGYIMYWIDEDIFHIKEMIYLNYEALKGLWTFISAHHSMVEKVDGITYRNEPIAFLLEDSHINETIEPYFMARIVDVKAFLESYPFWEKSESFHFVVTDPIANWNEGVFGVQFTEQGKVQVTNEKLGKGATLSIQTLTALMMSFRRPSYFYKIERLKTDPKTLKLLENIIPEQQPYFSDHF